jgi:hypothetical protein
MLPCNMIRSPQPRPATSSSRRRLPLAPFHCTYRPMLCLSPLPTSPNSTHPSQLDTPVPPQPLCYQSHPHAFRHTWGVPQCSLSILNSPFRTALPARVHINIIPRHLAVLCFHTLTHSFATDETLTPAFSIISALFAQNTGVGGSSFQRKPSIPSVAFAAVDSVSLSLTAHAPCSHLYPKLCLAPHHCYSSTNAEDPARTIPSSLGGPAGSLRGQERFRFPTHQIKKASQT